MCSQIKLIKFGQYNETLQQFVDEEFLIINEKHSFLVPKTLSANTTQSLSTPRSRHTRFAKRSVITTPVPNWTVLHVDSSMTTLQPQTTTPQSPATTPDLFQAKLALFQTSAWTLHQLNTILHLLELAQIHLTKWANEHMKFGQEDGIQAWIELNRVISELQSMNTSIEFIEQIEGQLNSTIWLLKKGQINETMEIVQLAQQQVHVTIGIVKFVKKESRG